MFTVMSLSVAAAHARDPDLSTLVASTVRASVNLAVLVALRATDPWSLFGDRRPALLTRGVLGGLSLLTYFGALSVIGVGEAAFLNQTSAVWVAALAPLVLGERTPRLVWVAVTGSMIGVALLAEPRSGDAVGRALALGSGLFAAGAYLSIRRAGETNSPVVIVFYFTLIATLLAGTLVLITGAPAPKDAATLGWLAMSGLAATGGQLIMTLAYRLGKAGPIAAAGATGALLHALGGWALFGQVPDARAAVGMAILLVSGVALPLIAAR